MTQPRQADGLRRTKWSRGPWIAGGVVAMAIGLGTSATSALARDAGDASVAARAVSGQELRQAKATPIREIAREAVPLEMPGREKRNLSALAGDGDPAVEGPEGPVQKLEGALGRGLRKQDRAAEAARAGGASARASVFQNGAWPGAYWTNPNRQVGKLYFDTQPGPGVSWSHCSATAVNSENKSLVMTAGHCVYSPDPDGNGAIDGNGRWYESVQFCPGYESGCRLGVFYAREISTTNSWFHGTNGAYDWSDDIATVLVHPHPSYGHLVNHTGGQGITWNASANQTRYAFGYPASDWRWPEYSYSGEDLQWCPSASTSVGTVMRINCTMTGGSSGGSWISQPDGNWLGYVNSVNSHKPWGGPYMGGPYFGNAEGGLFNYARAR